MRKLAGLAGGPTIAVAVAATVALLGAVFYVSGVIAPQGPAPQTVAQQVPETAEPTEATAAEPAEDVAEPADSGAETADGAGAAAPETGTVESTAADSGTAESAADETDRPKADTADTGTAETGAAATGDMTATTESTAPAEPADAAPTPTPPSIITFRLDPEGQMLISGRAEPGWETSVVMDDAVLLTFRPEGNGQFAEFLEIGESSEPRVLRLSMVSPETGETIVSKEEIIIAPSTVQVAVAAEDSGDTAAEPAMKSAGTNGDAAEPAAADPADAAPAATELAALDTRETGTGDTEVTDQAASAPDADTGGSADGGQTGQTGESPAPESETLNTPAEPVAETAEAADGATQAGGETAEASGDAAGGAVTAAVLMSDESGVRVIQPPEPVDAAPEVMSTVALDAITYSGEGEVALSGRGQGEAFVRVYLDNAPITTSRIAADGGWRSELPAVDTGVYTLRIDEVDAEGNVLSRVETPFRREAETVLSAAETARAVRAVTVQPGNTLWAISRKNYGEGLLYVRIFAANKDRIRNPDLIYPGQVIEIPN